MTKCSVCGETFCHIHSAKGADGKFYCLNDLPEGMRMRGWGPQFISANAWFRATERLLALVRKRPSQPNQP